MKKIYVSPEMEIVRYTLKDVLSGSPIEGGNVGDQFSDETLPDDDFELGDL